MKIKIRPYREEDYQFTHDLHRKNMSGYVDKYWGGWNSDIYRRDIRRYVTYEVTESHFMMKKKLSLET